jgi:hypothetical protein
VPSCDLQSARVIGSKIIPDTFNSLKMHYPKNDGKRRQELLSIRELLRKTCPADTYDHRKNSASTGFPRLVYH